MATSSGHKLNFLITGAGRGIGRGLSKLLVQRGHRVFLVDNNEEELMHTSNAINRALQSTSSSEKPISAQLCNLRRRADIERVAKAAYEFFGGHLDALINNAAYTGAVGGFSMTAPYTENDDAFANAWDASVETNLTASVLLSRACLPMLRRDPPRREQGGSIINMSSTRAHQSEPDSEGYAATKAGLIGLTHSMAVSLAPPGVRVNAILPGWINVENEQKVADQNGTKWQDGLSKADHDWHLTSRVGKVEDILTAVEYLVNAPFVTGSEMVVDGGVTRKMVYPE